MERATTIARQRIMREFGLNWTTMYSSMFPSRMIPDCETRFVEGVRFNKTWALCLRVSSHAMNHINARCAYLSEYAKRSSNGSFEALRTTFRGLGDAVVYNSTTLLHTINTTHPAFNSFGISLCEELERPAPRSTSDGFKTCESLSCLPKLRR